MKKIKIDGIEYFLSDGFEDQWEKIQNNKVISGNQHRKKAWDTIMKIVSQEKDQKEMQKQLSKLFYILKNEEILEELLQKVISKNYVFTLDELNAELKKVEIPKRKELKEKADDTSILSIKLK